jgi:hypothetical protein
MAISFHCYEVCGLIKFWFLLAKYLLCKRYFLPGARLIDLIP